MPLPESAAASASAEPEAVRSARRGEAAGWQSLVTQHGPRIYGLYRRLDPHPDDAYQEIWEKLCAELPRFDGQRPFGPWARTIARRHHIEGLPLTTVARDEGTAVGTIKSRLHRARARLLRLLGADP